VISSVSGGSLITALWAYGDEDFEAFDARVRELLRRGLQRRVARRALLSRRTPEQVATRVVAGGAASAARAAWAVRRATGARGPSTPPLRRWASRTDAFLDVLDRDVCDGRPITAPRRPGLDVVINACELGTGSAFRFGSRESGCWRVGHIPGNDVALATAVAASAAYPLLLPALDRKWTFQRRDGTTVEERVVLTDGGVFENLGTSCLEPGRSADYSYDVFPVDCIIACDAGRGLLDPVVTYGLAPRVHRAFDTTFRKLQDGARGRLHDLVAAGELEGFIMPYLGQQDRALPVALANLVRREQIATYPTDFKAMSLDTLTMLSARGEQLTLALLDAYLPHL
jgi:NTE family protein